MLDVPEPVKWQWPDWVSIDDRKLWAARDWFNQFAYGIQDDETDRYFGMLCMGARSTGKTAFFANMVGNDPKKNPADNPHIIYLNGHVTQ